MPPMRYVLTLSCPNRPGIVAAVSTALFEGGFNILDAQQFDDIETGDLLHARRLQRREDARRRRGDARRLAEMARAFAMTWTMRALDERSAWPCWSRASTIVWSICSIAGAAANCRWTSSRSSPTIRARLMSTSTSAISRSIIFPVTETDQDGAGDPDLGDRARSRRPTSWCSRATCRFCRTGSPPSSAAAASTSTTRSCPASRAPNPIIRRTQRGVKLIGATAHFVTSDLDEGPIIEQDVERITHRDTPDDLVRKGRDIERRVLARALAHHLEDRVLINGGKTVVFEG